MQIILSINDRREINKILGLLKSPDPEANRLGVQLCKTSDVLSRFRGMWYVTLNRKEIPVSWFVEHALQEMEKQVKENINDPYRYTRLLIPLLESINNGETRFKEMVHFEFENEKEI